MNRRQTIPKELRYTRQQFDKDFPDDDACLEQIKEQRWPNGVRMCHKCGVERKHYRVSGRTAFACDHCGNHVYPLAGTIFEKSSTSLRIWFQAMYLMGSTRCGISAKQIQRETGVTYKTAWRMFRQIRSLLSEPDMQLEGAAVEMDEMYYGGTRKGGAGRPMRGDKVKTAVVGIVERGGKGRVIAKATNDVTGATLTGMVREYVLPQSTVFTDELPAYNNVGEILMNSAGNPISMEVEEIEEMGARAPALRLSLEQIAGSIKDFTGGRSLREYLEESEDE